MTYVEHDLLAFGGMLGHPEEQWTCGIRMVAYGDAAGTHPDHEAYLTDIAIPALTTWFASPNTKIHQECRINWVKFNAIGPDGKYMDPGATHERQGLNLVGGVSGAANAHPLQVCWVASFRSDVVTRGKGSMGRIYTPRPVVLIDTNGDVAAATRQAAATQTATLLNTLDVGLGGPGGFLRPSIVSRGTAPGFADEGPANWIDRVIYDSCLDVQRRRAYSQSREESFALVTY